MGTSTEEPAGMTAAVGDRILRFLMRLGPVAQRRRHDWRSLVRALSVRTHTRRVGLFVCVLHICVFCVCAAGI